MNTYNSLVIDQYCCEVGYSAEQKKVLVDRLTGVYGDRMNTESLFRINNKDVMSEAALVVLLNAEPS